MRCETPFLLAAMGKMPSVAHLHGPICPHKYVHNTHPVSGSALFVSWLLSAMVGNARFGMLFHRDLFHTRTRCFAVGGSNSGVTKDVTK